MVKESLFFTAEDTIAVHSRLYFLGYFQTLLPRKVLFETTSQKVHLKLFNWFKKRIFDQRKNNLYLIGEPKLSL